MSIRKLEDGRYLVDIRPCGSDGKRYRKRFPTLGEARAYERHMLITYQQKEWAEKPRNRQKLTEIIGTWWQVYGSHINNGDQTMKRLDAVIRELSDLNIIRVDHLNRKTMALYRSAMMGRGLKSSTVNRTFAMLSGVFTKLIEYGFFSAENPFKGIKKLRTDVNEMAWLTSDEVERLISTLAGDDRRAAIMCLATGARWGEVQSVKAEHIIDGKVIFMKTKNGNRRVVPVSMEVEKLVKTRKSGKLFSSSYQNVRQAIKSVKPDTPNGQGVHILRHTFATHFMINGGNIITLQRILGHATIRQTMTYAHFAPDYLEEATRLNPLKGIAF
ncbi:tyrosine-type recombinase/integrase [Escherichia coli]|nr:tyrosine-type recombinase/integrase [Escherichia coli]